MKSPLLAMPMLALAAFAHAQTGSSRSESLPPLQQQWQQQGTPPLQQAPPGPMTTNQDQQAPGSPPPLAAAPSANAPSVNAPLGTIERPDTWLPATVVKLQALDKVNAQAAALTIKVGATTTFGSLTIIAKACVVRPADQPADAAAFLDVTDSHPDAPGFNGWMLRDEPAVSMMEHPIYDLRVTGCA